MSTTASEEFLGNLHKLMAEEFTAWLVSGLPVFKTDKESGDLIEVGTRRPTAAEMSVMAAFLNNNKITATPAQSDAVAKLNELMASKRAARQKNKVMPSADIHIDLHDFQPGGLNG